MIVGGGMSFGMSLDTSSGCFYTKGAGFADIQGTQAQRQLEGYLHVRKLLSSVNVEVKDK